MAHLAAIGIIVEDLERAGAFYRRLGVEFPDPIDPDGHGHAEATGPGGLRIMLDTRSNIEADDPNWKRPAGGHALGLAFECSSPSDVNDTFSQLLAAGATPYREPWDAFWGQRYAQVKDPDGNVIDLFAPLQ